MEILIAEDLKKSYLSGAQPIEVLKGVSFRLRPSDSVAIMGPSGSGKSTLLQILGAMLQPDAGTLRIGDRDMLTLSDTELSKVRRRRLGFVFQKFNLLGTLTALDNVAWPLLIDGRDATTALKRARELLERVGLSARMGHYPRQLSGGEQQRVAIARSLVASPAIVFADEPTGALDSKTGLTVLELLKETVLSEKSALVMVTHDESAARYCEQRLNLRDGRPC
jgi:putative ABC transport system ATP-binding protein